MMNLFKALFYEGGRFSVTRMWKHVAYAVATWIVLHMGTSISWEMMALYLSVIAADNRAGAIIRSKFQGSGLEPNSRYQQKPLDDNELTGPLGAGHKTPED